MILPKLQVLEQKYYTGQYYGCDHPDWLNKYSNDDRIKFDDSPLTLHTFNSYPYIISYRFNSRGLRDEDWIDNLTDCNFCVGDSNVIGVGVPYNNTFVKILEDKFHKRFLNCGKSGADNYSWVFKNSLDILQTVKPITLLVFWSPFHKNHTKKKIRFLFSDEHDISVIKTYISSLEKNKGDTKVVHIFNYKYHNVYNFLEQMSQEPINQTVFYRKDYARDGIHFGIDSHADLAEQLSSYVR